MKNNEWLYPLNYQLNINANPKLLFFLFIA